ncbi:MAG: hypothetical protein ACO34J_09300 [Prochlorothrix sp.]
MFVRNLIYLGFLAMIAGSCSTVEPTATDLEGSQPVPEATTTAEPSAKLTLEEALKTAYDTSVLTQTAKTIADWEQVQQGWQSAIDQLATIPESSEQGVSHFRLWTAGPAIPQPLLGWDGPLARLKWDGPSEQYGQAQQKISDYQKNLAYALQELDKARQFSAPVFMTLTAEATADPRVVIRGETNLPDGSEILISMDNNLGASFQDKAMVTQGKFETTLGPPAGLETAQYSIDAVFSPFAQSEEVQAIVGRKGEKLTGNLVSTSTLIEGLKIASTDPINLLIGDAVAVSNSDAANQELVKQVYSSAQGLLAQAKATG